MNSTPSSVGREIRLPKNSLGDSQEVKQEISQGNLVRKQATKRLQDKFLERIFSVGRPEVICNRLSYPFKCFWGNETAEQEPPSKSVQVENSTHEKPTKQLQGSLLQRIRNVGRPEVNRSYQPTNSFECSASNESAEQDRAYKSVQAETQTIILNEIVSNPDAYELVFLRSIHKSADSCGTIQGPLKQEVKLEQNTDKEAYKLCDTPLQVDDASNSLNVEIKSGVSSYVQKKHSVDVFTGSDDDSSSVEVRIKSEECSEVEEDKSCSDVDVAPTWEYVSCEHLLPPKTEVVSSGQETIYQEKPKEDSVKPLIILERDIYNTTVNRAHDTVISINTMSKVPQEFLGRLPENVNVFQLTSSNTSKNKRLLLFGCLMPQCSVCNVPFKTARNRSFHFRNVHKGIPRPKHLRTNGAYSHVIRASIIRETRGIPEAKKVVKEICVKAPDQRKSRSKKKKQFTKLNKLNFKWQKSYKSSLSLCAICGKSFYPHYLKKHMRVHDARCRQYTCDICGKSYLSNGVLTKHIKNYHTTQSPHQCSECNRKCTTASGLKIHIRLKHSTNFQFVCHICGEQFVRRDYLKRHIRRHYLPGGHTMYSRSRSHKKPRPVCCKYCSKVFASVVWLRYHLLTHIKGLRYKCQFCSLTFSCSQSRSRHEKRHNDPDYKLSCTICWHRMNTKQELEKHLKVHDKSKKYACQTCAATFASKYWLNHHIIEHVSKEEVEAETKVVLEEGLKGAYF